MIGENLRKICFVYKCFVCKCFTNVLYTKNEKMYPAYVSKHNLNREKQVILLMFPNGKKRHYLAVKSHQHY